MRNFRFSAEYFFSYFPHIEYFIRKLVHLFDVVEYSDIIHHFLIVSLFSVTLNYNFVDKVLFLSRDQYQFGQKKCFQVIQTQFRTYQKATCC